jgi:hypothetical protein
MHSFIHCSLYIITAQLCHSNPKIFTLPTQASSKVLLEKEPGCAHEVGKVPEQAATSPKRLTTRDLRCLHATSPK